MLQDHWIHLALEGGGALVLCAATSDGGLAPGQALVVSDDAQRAGVQPFVAVLQLAMRQPGCTAAFVHPADLTAFTLYLAGANEGRTLH